MTGLLQPIYKPALALALANPSNVSVIIIIIAYHYSRECVASGMARVAHEQGSSNLADLFTKVLESFTRNGLLNRFMY